MSSFNIQSDFSPLVVGFFLSLVSPIYDSFFFLLGKLRPKLNLLHWNRFLIIDLGAVLSCLPKQLMGSFPQFPHPNSFALLFYFSYFMWPFFFSMQKLRTLCRTTWMRTTHLENRQLFLVRNGNQTVPFMNGLSIDPAFQLFRHAYTFSANNDWWWTNSR